MITYDIDGITVMPPLLAEYRLDPTPLTNLVIFTLLIKTITMM